MAEDDPELQYRVTGTADTGAVDQATKSLGGFKDSASEASHGMRELVGASRHGSEILRGLEAASRGGAGGIMEMVRGVRALIMVVSGALGGPLSALLVALGAIAGAFLVMKSHAKEGGDGLDDASKKAEEFKKRLDNIKTATEADFEPLKKALKEINEAFDRLNERSKDASSGVSKLEKAQKELTDSTLELSKAKELSAAKDDTERAYIQKKYEGIKAETDAKEKLNTVGDDLLAAQTKQAQADENARQVSAIAEEGRNKVGAAEKQLSDATASAKVQVSLADSIAGPGGRGTEETLAQRAQAFQNVAEARKRLKTAQEEQTPLEEASGKAKFTAEQAGVEVANAQLAAQKETTAAINRLAAVLIEKKNLDKADVTGGGESSVGEEKTGSVSEKEGRVTKAAAESQDAAENHRDAAAERAAEGHAKSMNKVSETINKHADTVASAAEAIVAHVAKGTKRVERAQANIENAASFGGTSP